MKLTTRPVYDLNRVMDISEAAAILRVSKKHVYAWIEEGELEACETPGICSRMVVVPSIIPESSAEPAQRRPSSKLVVKAPHSVGLPAPRNPALEGIDPSFLEAASKLIMTAEQITRLVSRGTLAVVDGKITRECVAAYKRANRDDNSGLVWATVIDKSDDNDGAELTAAS
jgi:excisionase family DNA binding protein